MSVKLLTEHHLEFLSLKGDCTGSSESRLVKIPHCWKSHVTAHMFVNLIYYMYYTCFLSVCFRYTADVDKTMTVLKIVDVDGNPFGMLW